MRSGNAVEGEDGVDDALCYVVGIIQKSSCKRVWRSQEGAWERPELNMAEISSFRMYFVMLVGVGVGKEKN